MLEKTHEQKDAEADIEGFQAALGPFVVAAETTRMPMVFTNAKEGHNPIIFANDSFLSLTGYDRDDLLGRALDFLLAPQTDPPPTTRLDNAFARTSGGDSQDEAELHCCRKDGSTFWAVMFVSPVRDYQGNVVQHFVSFVDVSKRMRVQAHAAMLIDELNHRVKNTLSTVLSIVEQSFRGSTDVAVIRDALEGRVFALSRSHDLLTKENRDSASLEDVVGAALEPFVVAEHRVDRLVIKGITTRLAPRVTLMLSIALHELATNAVKYGAFSNEVGSIAIDWDIEPSPTGDRLMIRWQEQGGPPVTAPSQNGFGSTLIERGLPYELNATVDLKYTSSGVVCTTSIPLERQP